MSYIVTVKHVRKVIPRSVPTDIIKLIHPYLYPELKEPLRVLYDELFRETTIKEDFLRDYFDKRITTWFLKNIGYNYPLDTLPDLGYSRKLVLANQHVQNLAEMVQHSSDYLDINNEPSSWYHYTCFLEHAIYNIYK
jgi:hypothetical protein